MQPNEVKYHMKSNMLELADASRPVSFKSWEQAVEWLRDDPSQQELVMAAYYDDPITQAANRYYNSEEWISLRSYLPMGRGVALDIGAGRGIASYALAKEGYRVTALEPDPSALVGAQAIRTLAEETNLPIEVTEDFSETLPFPDNSYDLVFARAVLHHTSDLEAACREFSRVLKPGGLFIAVREHVISKPEDINQFFDIHPLHKIYGGENAFLLEEYLTAIKNSGLALSSTIRPFDSAINYAPHTLASLKTELAERLARYFPVGKRFFSKLLSSSFFWHLFLPLLTAIDNRPGRLYSFIAKKA